MVGNEFKEGEIWAYRAKTSAEDAIPVRLLRRAPKRAGKKPQYRIEYHDPEYEGLQDWVTAQSLICRWDEWPVRQKRERAMRDLQESAEYSSRNVSPILRQASMIVFDAFMEDVAFTAHYASQASCCSKVGLEALKRLCARAAIKFDSAFWHKVLLPNGEVFVRDSDLVALAQSLAKAEPETVDQGLKLEEELMGREFLYDRAHHLKILLDSKPAMAVARQWAGLKREELEIKLRNAKLEKLVLKAVLELKNAGLEKAANRISKELQEPEWLM